MIRIGHFADTHLGYRQYGLSERENDFYEQFNKIIDDMIEKKVDLIIHSGDLFEQPKPPIKALLTAQAGFMKLLNNNIPVYVIAGNHDKLQRSDSSIPQELYENENFHILSPNKTTVYNDELFIGGISFIGSSNQEMINKALNIIKDKSEGYKYKILVLHGGTEKNFKLNPEFDNETIPYGFDYYAMGHIHNRIVDSFHEATLSYPGSTEMRSANELNDYRRNGKGYNIVTFDEDNEKIVSVEQVRIPLRREFIQKDIEYPKLEEELDKIYDKIITYEYKPLLFLTVKKGDFDRSEVMQEVHDKLKRDSLTIKLNYEPTDTETGEDITEEQQTAEQIIAKKTMEKYEDEEITKLALNLYKQLSIPNSEEALKISKNHFEKRYEMEL